MMRPGKEVRLRAAREGRALPKDLTYRVITFAKDDKVAFDEIKNHLGSGRPLRSRTPEAVRQELWALLAVHQAVRRLAHSAASSSPVVDADRLSYLRCVRIARRSVPSQLGSSEPILTSAWSEAAQEARSHLLPPRTGRVQPRAIKKPVR